MVEDTCCQTSTVTSESTEPLSVGAECVEVVYTTEAAKSRDEEPEVFRDDVLIVLHDERPGDSQCGSLLL